MVKDEQVTSTEKRWVCSGWVGSAAWRKKAKRDEAFILKDEATLLDYAFDIGYIYVRFDDQTVCKCIVAT